MFLRFWFDRGNLTRPYLPDGYSQNWFIFGTNLMDIYKTINELKFNFLEIFYEENPNLPKFFCSITYENIFLYKTIFFIAQSSSKPKMICELNFRD